MPLLPLPIGEESKPRKRAESAPKKPFDYELPCNTPPMHGQKHSFWRLIFLSHSFYEAFVGCFKAQPKVPLVRAVSGGCCSTSRSGEGRVGSCGHPREQERLSTIHSCSITSFLPQMGLCGWQEWLFVWACNRHAWPWPPASIPPERAAGSISAPAALLAFSRFVCGRRWDRLFFLQLTWTKKWHKLLVNGLQMETAAVWLTSGFRKQTMRREFLLVV